MLCFQYPVSGRKRIPCMAWILEWIISRHWLRAVSGQSPILSVNTFVTQPVRLWFHVHSNLRKLRHFRPFMYDWRRIVWVLKTSTQAIIISCFLGIAVFSYLHPRNRNISYRIFQHFRPHKYLWKFNSLYPERYVCNPILAYHSRSNSSTTLCTNESIIQERGEPDECYLERELWYFPIYLLQDILISFASISFPIINCIR